MDNDQYWKNRKLELQHCLDNGLVFRIDEKDSEMEVARLQGIKVAVCNLSKYAWEQSPEEMRTILRAIYDRTR